MDNPELTPEEDWARDKPPRISFEVWRRMTKDQRDEWRRQVQWFKDRLEEEKRAAKKRAYGY